MIRNSRRGLAPAVLRLPADGAYGKLTILTVPFITTCIFARFSLK